MRGRRQMARQRGARACGESASRCLLSRVSVSAPGLRGQGACGAVAVAMNRPAPVEMVSGEVNGHIRHLRYHGGRLPFATPGCQAGKLIPMEPRNADIHDISRQR